MSDALDIEIPAPTAAAPDRHAPEPADGPGPSRRSDRAARVPGLAVALAVAVAGTAAGRLVPVVGGPVSGILLGVLVAVLLGPRPRLRPGIEFAGKPVLKSAVVILGSQLSLVRIVGVGVGSLPVMLGTLGLCLAAAYGLGRWLGVVGDLRTLIGVGTGVCGASAIAAVTPVIGAAGAEVAYAVSTVFLFNIAAVLAFPVIGHLLGLSQHAFGLFAGTAVNDMSSVVAAAATYGPDAADYGVVVKLTRTLMIIPICLVLSALASRRARRGAGAAAVRVRVTALVPGFLLAFLAVAAANTAGLVPAGARHGLGELSVFLITVALSAIGLSTDLGGLRRAGPRPLILGGCLWVVVSAGSLGLQWLTGTL
ncbi:YeiH family protein [Streptomyces sp. NRRL B-24484]|uniref:YeiH family protein n=1 Tax=Streptomyces sp. NRRL B-24484 TaxID=1463833 RepID=UPI00099849A9|nr:putative sulfate exporter family transporter [Streptomyces sp. NRRL B-24484]